MASARLAEVRVLLRYRRSAAGVSDVVGPSKTGDQSVQQVEIWWPRGSRRRAVSPSRAQGGNRAGPRNIMATQSQEFVMTDANPKLDPNPPTNTEKDPDDWVSGDDPMTGAQASYLKTLSEEVQQPEAFEAGLSKSEASKRIDDLKGRLSAPG